ncbi:MAG: ATP-binding protein [Pseudohongiellaceae bacterium]
MFKRNLNLPAPGKESFFLWGPRQTGKSTLLRAVYGDGLWIDLLKSEEYRRYLSRPELLRQNVEAITDQSVGSTQVVIDEIQKVPALLDEVHGLIESRGLRFALCGSSARKVKRGAANLLGGRAARYELHGISASELGQHFNLDRLLNSGYLPSIFDAAHPQRMLDAYIADYLKEEIAAEGLTRNLPAFSDFLDAAAFSDGEIVNYSNIARDSGVSNNTTKGYFQILIDTLLGRWLPAYRKRAKRRVIRAPKFYFADVGIVNRLAHRGELQAGGELYGKAFENWIFHELTTYLSYSENPARLSYWRLASGAEVDFIIGDMAVAIEAKSSTNITNNHLRGLRNLVQDYPDVGRRILVCREPKARRMEDGVEILPFGDFIGQLWGGGIV